MNTTERATIAAAFAAAIANEVDAANKYHKAIDCGADANCDLFFAALRAQKEARSARAAYYAEIGK